MKKAKREKRKLSRGKKILIAVLSPFMALVLAVVLYIGGLIVWMQFGWDIMERIGKPADILSDWANPWRRKEPEQEDWRQIVQNSQFTLGEPLLEKTTDQKGWTEWTLSLPDATFPIIDGSTVMIPMAVEFARQHLGMNHEQASRLFEFSTTQYALEKFCSGDSLNNTYYFYDYFDGVDLVWWDSGRPIDLLLGPPVDDAAFVQKPVCRDAFVFITGKDNPVDSLTLEQLRGIFSGQITNWKQVGGADAKIRAYQREAGSGSQLAMEQLVMQGTPMADPKTVKVIAGMGELVDAVAEYENSAASIGYSYRYYIDNQYSSENIKQLKIEGVAPTQENIISEAYPLSVNYYGVIRKGDEEKPGGLFLDWILSPEGQACVKQAGYMPLGLPADPPASEIASELAFFADDGKFFGYGFTLYKDGTGVYRHNWEGGFDITSYTLTDDKLRYTLLNMDDEAVSDEVSLGELTRVKSIVPDGMEYYWITFMDGKTACYVAGKLREATP